MKKQMIEVEGLSNDIRVTKIRYVPHHGVGAVNWVVETEKIKPRRIVLEETDEFASIEKRGYVLLDGGTIEFKRQGDTISPPHKLWREVKETDIPLNNEEPYLKLSLEQCKKFANGGFLGRVEICRLIEDSL